MHACPQVTADLRTISSNTFATPLSLRFPIIKRMRDDRSPHTANTVEWLQQIGDEGANLPGTLRHPV